MLKQTLPLLMVWVVIIFLSEVLVKLHFFGWYDGPKDLLIPSESPVLVYELRPGANITTTYLNPMQRSWKYSASINQQGFRGHAVERSPTRPRVIILGDSYAFGYGVNDDETFARLLQEKFHNSAEVLNWGVPGYNLVQAVELLATKGEEYEPDVVIIAQHYNDFEPAVLQNAREVQYVLWSHMYSVYRHIKFLNGGRIETKLARNRDERIQRGFKAFDEFVRLAQKRNFEPVLFRSSCLGGYDQRDMDRLFARSRSLGVRTIDTDARFCRRLFRHLIPDDGHPTPAGHELLAEELRPHIAAALR